jgi:hypothetical protein
MASGGLMRNGTDMRLLLRSRTGLRDIMYAGGGMFSVMVKGRQEHTTFQVFDADRELYAAAGNSTTGLTGDIRGQHGPSWA